ncbi:hypothetical protein J6590_084819 [Homalodisca vitripennis]|nr:hypothetical protein J6590_084819 [Homalodisca vitripennis]
MQLVHQRQIENKTPKRRPPSETPAWIRQRIPTGGQHFPNAADVELHSGRRRQSGVSAWRKAAEGGLRQVHGGLCDAGAQGNQPKIDNLE